MNGQREYYNQIADRYDNAHGDSAALDYRYSLLDKLVTNIDVSRLHVLDASAGGGYNSEFFLKRGAKLTGNDLSDAQCALFAKRLPGVPIFNYSISKTGFSSDEFDAVFIDALHHLGASLPEAMSEIYRILKPGGMLLLWEPNARSPLEFLRRFWYRLDPVFFQPEERSLDLGKFVKSYGHLFEVQSEMRVGSVAYLLVEQSAILRIPNSLVRRYAGFARRLEDWIERGRSRREWLTILAILRKVGS